MCTAPRSDIKGIPCHPSQLHHPKKLALVSLPRAGDLGPDLRVVYNPWVVVVGDVNAPAPHLSSPVRLGTMQPQHDAREQFI
jgi:hypothetical protein